jgi:hypothetical protein
MADWDRLSINVMSLLAASMRQRIKKLCNNEGNRLDYQTPRPVPMGVSKKVNFVF